MFLRVFKWKLSKNHQTKISKKFPKFGEKSYFFFQNRKIFFLKSIQNCLKRVLNRKSWNRFCEGDPGDRSIFSSIRPTKGPFGAFCRPYFGYCRPHEMGHIPKSYYFLYTLQPWLILVALLSISANFCHILTNCLQIFIDFKMNFGRKFS